MENIILKNNPKTVKIQVFYQHWNDLHCLFLHLSMFQKGGVSCFGFVWKYFCWQNKNRKEKWSKMIFFLNLFLR